MKYNNKETDIEDLTISFQLEDGTELTCDILCRYPLDGKQYIALAPVDSKDIFEDIMLYRFEENNAGDPQLIYIEDDDEYEAAADRFDEILDEQEYDELMDGDEQ